MKLLFKITAFGADEYFCNKPAAKLARDTARQDQTVPEKHIHVHRGPDHWKGETP